MKVFILGIAGGSGSGKTTLARMIQNEIGPDACSILSQDHYYIDQSARFKGDGEDVNFDHPDSLDWKLLSDHLNDLRSGRSIRVPIYDFSTHTRKAESTPFPAVRLVLLDGTLIYTQPSILKQLDHKIFVDTSESVRFDRRLKRDTEERGRTEDGVRKQFMNHVKPMHDLFVEPSKSAADLVVIENSDALERFLKLFRNVIS